MDEFQEGYAPDENYNGPMIEEGDHLVKVINVQGGFSKKGTPMLTIEIQAKNCPIIFKHFIVKNEYFNANMTKFFDCFKIPRGNFEYNRWVGRVGKAHIGKGSPNPEGKAYMELQYLIVEQKGATPGPQPAMQPAARPAPVAAPKPQQEAVVMPFDDDIPF